jgi:metal-dependent amidase/aminoacylase/carboxypeptidase family protein
VTVNDPTEAAFAAGVVTEVLGEGRYIEMPHAVAGSEDLGVLDKLVPSAYVMLGATPADRDPSPRPTTTRRRRGSTTASWATARPCWPVWRQDVSHAAEARRARRAGPAHNP